MMRATMDIIALYNYDNNLFSGMSLPTQVDRATLVDNLLMECAELELLYTSHDFMQSAINAWSAKQLPVWVELAKTLEYEYNPIWNKDYHVSRREDRSFRGTEDVTTNTDDDSSYSGSTTGTNTGSGTDLHTVYGFNSNTDAPESKDTTNNTVTSSGTASSTDNRDIRETIDRDTTDTGNIKNEDWERGNIGVMSTQDLIKQQREVVQFNLIDYIIKDFKNRFCLGVY